MEYDEFGFLSEVAIEHGLDCSRPPIVRREFVPLRDGREVSALVWGDGPADVVLIHGGAQNAHTWDTVALALGRPLAALDLPAHGHSDGPSHEADAMLPVGLARDVADALTVLAPNAKCVVGMSLGGLTAIALAAARPELVRGLVLVDVTPGVTGEKAKAVINFLQGPATFASFDDLLAWTIEHNPTRTEASLRRGALHNAKQLDDGTWVWRYRRSALERLGAADVRPSREPDHAHLWQELGRLRVPLLLLRGMQTGSVVDDAGVAELLRRRPDAAVLEIAEAGHNVQGDAPLRLAAAISDFLDVAEASSTESDSTTGSDWA